MRKRAVLSGLAALVLAGAAWADEVTLRSGRKIVGIAREEGDRIIVEMPLGTVGFPKDDVVSITPGRTLLHDYRDKAEAVRDTKDAKDFYALAKWARENGLTRYVNPNLQKCLELDPNHEWARRELGYVLHNGKWMTQEEIYKEQGFVWFEGRWMSQLEMQLIIRKRLDAEQRRLEEAAARKRRQEEARQAHLAALQEQYDRLAEEARLRRMERRWRRQGFGPDCDFASFVPLSVARFMQARGFVPLPVLPFP